MQIRGEHPQYVEILLASTEPACKSSQATFQPTNMQLPRASLPVQDDWDNDDNEESGEPDPQTLWDEA